MSPRSQAGVAAQRRSHAPVFAALGDETRLSLVARLCCESPQSIAQLARRSPLTRQAISKHLQVLRAAGIVASVRVGRESRYALRPEPIDRTRDYLDDVSKRWDASLERLKAMVER
jgi:DNA-binding transcriptional ArsR family regulator